MNGRVLVAGVGNIFFGDDGFGVEVVRRLSSRPLPERVAVVDFGIRGLHLAYELLEPYDAVVIADAMYRGDAPGTLYLLDPGEPLAASASADAHGMDLPTVFSMARDLGATLEGISIVGCEPESTDESLGLGSVVTGSIDPAIDLVMKIVTETIERSVDDTRGGAG